MTTGFASGIRGTVAGRAGSLSPGQTRGGVSGPLAGELIMSLIDRFPDNHQRKTESVKWSGGVSDVSGDFVMDWGACYG